MNPSVDVTLTRNAQFSPICTGVASSVLDGFSSENSTVINFRDPFYASVAPQFFAIAAATVVAYFLVIVIFITPGSFVVGGPGGGRALLGRRDMISGTYRGSPVVGIGRRPWLQKIAALTVAISLTIASADTFKFCRRQYEAGYSNAGKLVEDVNAGLQIRIVRVISDTFLWLAQVQTLIRLFPRHKEKVAIKWVGFALILLDTIFSILNNFIYQSVKSRPRLFQDAIPALSYLFDLAIGFIYASCVVYYSWSKRRFAFWHPKMKNICLVAICSLMAVLVPVVFFVLDISNSDVDTWGEYIRWVGAAAASVVVWEWVERIEALERDERKDGILGREIFDGDEMLDMTPSEEVFWPGRSPHRRNNNDRGAGNASGRANRDGTAAGPLRSRMPFQNRPSISMTATDMSTSPVADRGLSNGLDQRHPALPPQAVVPVSRTDTSSASTVYEVRRLALSTPSPQIPEHWDAASLMAPKPPSSDGTMVNVTETRAVNLTDGTHQHSATDLQSTKISTTLWRAVPNPFKRRRASPPAEVAGAQATAETLHDPPATGLVGRTRTRLRVDAFAASQRRKFRARGKGPSVGTPFEVTVIPAQRRGQRTWSPDELADPVVDEDEVHTEHEHSQVDVRDDPPAHQPDDEADLPVTVIPSPSRNQHRTWSPQEMDEPSTHATSLSPRILSQANIQHESPQDCIDQGRPNSLGEEPPERVSDRVGKAPSNGQGPSGTWPSGRGTIITSEDESRNLSGSHKPSIFSLPLVRSSTKPVAARSESSPKNQRDCVEAEDARPAAPDPDVAVDNDVE